MTNGSHDATRSAPDAEPHVPAAPRRICVSPLLVSLLGVLIGTAITFFTFAALADRATSMDGGLGNAAVAIASLYGGGLYLLVAMATQLELNLFAKRVLTPAQLLGRSTLVASVVLVVACLALALVMDAHAVLAGLVVAALVLAPILVFVTIGWLVCRRTIWARPA